MTVIIFNDLSAEPGEPNKLLLLAKLAKPELSWGVRKKIIIIKTKLIKNPVIFNIFLSLLSDFYLLNIQLELLYC